MIFVAAENEPTMVLMLAEKDIVTMREGRTVFVDDRFTKGFEFNKVVLSLHATNEEALALLNKAKGQNHVVSEERTEPAKPGEERCAACKGYIAVTLMFEDKCNVCWVAEAKRLKAAIVEAHSQHGDDLCWMPADVNKVFVAAGLPPQDLHVGDLVAMRKNCDRYTACLKDGGPWKSYADLEKENAELRERCAEA